MKFSIIANLEPIIALLESDLSICANGTFIEKISIFGLFSVLMWLFIDYDFLFELVFDYDDTYWDDVDIAIYLALEFVLLFIVFGGKKK